MCNILILFDDLRIRNVLNNFGDSKARTNFLNVQLGSRKSIFGNKVPIDVDRSLYISRSFFLSMLEFKQILFSIFAM